MRKFRTSYREKIEEFEVIKETKSQITFIRSQGRESKERKLSSYHSWHDTKEEAKEYLIECYRQSIEHKEMQINSDKAKIEKIKLL